MLGYPDVVHPAFSNYDEKDFSSKIKSITCLRKSALKIMFIVPLLSILFSIFFFVALFYFPSVRKKVFYSECKLNKATHLYIVGEEKNAIELVKLKDYSPQIKNLIQGSENSIQTSKLLMF